MDGKIEDSKPKHSAEFLALSDADKPLVTEEAVRQVKILESRQPNPFKTGADRTAQIEEYRRQFASNPETLSSLRQNNADKRRAGMKRSL